LGNCVNFQAFPGHGLKCTVSDVSQFLDGHEIGRGTSVTVKLLEKPQPTKQLEEGVASGEKKFQVVLGNRKWVGLNGFEVSSEVDRIITSNEKRGRTVILVGINGKNVAWEYSCVTITQRKYILCYVL